MRLVLAEIRLVQQGRIQDFPKGGVETRDTKSGGGGGCCRAVRFRSDTKSEGGGGGAVRFRPDTKSGGGCCPALQARYKKRGKGGRGCLAEKGAVPYMKGGVATPKTPPPPPGSASVQVAEMRLVLAEMRLVPWAPPAFLEGGGGPE